MAHIISVSMIVLGILMMVTALTRHRARDKWDVLAYVTCILGVFGTYRMHAAGLISLNLGYAIKVAILTAVVVVEARSVPRRE
jgi:uncharacterized membrane protein HdeD (DUF308 family)